MILMRLYRDCGGNVEMVGPASRSGFVDGGRGECDGEWD